MKRIFLTACALSVTLVCSAQNRPEPVGAPGAEPAPAPGEKATRSRRGSSSFGSGGGGFGITSSQLSALVSGKTSRGDSIPPVVIRFSEPDPKANAELEQDLYVMARVLSRMLERAEGEHVEFKMKVPMVLTGAGKSVRPMYIEGTGPLFLIKVNFPLMAAPKATASNAAKPTPDSEWDEAERDLYGTGTVDFLDDDLSSSAGYNEGQVELLKREIMVALKNTTNIRSLKADEFFNVVVFGQSVGRRSGAPEPPGAPAKGTVMTLRVRKSDADAFAGGKVDFDAFKTKVSTVAYIGSGAGMTSINSWLQDAGKSGRQ